MRLGSVSERASPREPARTIVASVCLLLFASFSTLPDLFFLLAHSCPTSLKDMQYIVCVGASPPIMSFISQQQEGNVSVTGDLLDHRLFPDFKYTYSHILDPEGIVNNALRVFLDNAGHRKGGGWSLKHLCCTMTEKQRALPQHVVSQP